MSICVRLDVVPDLDIRPTFAQRSIADSVGGRTIMALLCPQTDWLGRSRATQLDNIWLDETHMVKI